ncbi:contactin-associated protein-like 4 isoform X2 [Clavelina lepadiformis]|uniref:contactin-associated protein-like 4 isoform X2 n=1 Tax=Clavelina lepadiformis TaxID=159417 RepID=UPI00404133F1
MLFHSLHLQISIRNNIKMYLKFLSMLSLILGALSQPDDGRSCLGNTVYNYFYGSEGQTVNPNLNPIGPQQQGKPGKIGPRGNKGEKGPKGEPGQSDNTARELDKMQSELDELKAKFQAFSAPPSCDHISNKKYSGTYLISPDPYQVAPFYAYCNFTSAETVIEHDTMEEMAVPKCAAPKCFRRRIRYNVDMDQIVALIERSTSCRQYIKYRCRASVIFFDGGVDHASWVSRDGTQIHYWGGATSRRSGYCACGETGTCVDSSKKCNCDRNTAPETSDEGYLTDKEVLPVTGLFFGDTDGSAEFGWHTLGPLICSGRQ